MVHLGIRKLKKYLQIYLTLIKFEFILRSTYRMSFLFEVGVDVGYSLASIFFFNILYRNINEIVGWTYYEILFLVGLNIIFTQIILDVFMANRLFALPQKIKDGEIDMPLLKPLSSLFYLTVKGIGPSTINMLPGVFLVFYALVKLAYLPNFLAIFFGSIIFICGILIGYSIITIITTITFKLNSSSDNLPRLGFESIDYYGSNPHQIYSNIALKTLFYIIFPIIYISSVPASTILNGVDYRFLLAALLLAATFLTITIKFWNRMIKHYSSASS